jgi:ribosomal-protein-alanine acetyltransferase
MRFVIAPLGGKFAGRLSEIEESWNPRPWSRQLFEDELCQPHTFSRGVFLELTELALGSGCLEGHSGDRLGEQHLVAYIIAHRILDEAHIVSFAVTEGERRSGLGSLLLGTALSQLKADGVAIVTLDVRVSNDAARRLYESFGFAVVGVREHYYSSNQEDALTMRCVLSS